MVKVLNFKAIIKQDEDGVFVASVPAIPGCHSQGRTYEEALENIQEAVELCLEVAEENPSYKAKIDWSEPKDGKSRFLGVVDISARATSV